MDTPFLNSIYSLAENTTRFFVPGHKGNPNALPFCSEIAKYDLTEVDGADDLSNPSESLAQSQRNMAKAYGSGATLYSASGSSSCIQAMLFLFAGADAPVVIARNCHVSAVRAIAFLNAKPFWVSLQNGVPSPNTIQAALVKSGAKTVYITSPDYYGNMADIASISAVCKQHNAALLVDNAHGAYLHFLPQSLHPLYLGADCTCDSAHKTLPCLTPAALLHLRNGAMANKARQMLNLFSSTSPSYLVLQSLDHTAGLLLSGSLNFAATAAQVAAVAKALPHLAEPVQEPLKLCLCPPKAGWHTEEVLASMQKAGILAEFSDENFIVLMASPYNTPHDFTLLLNTLKQFVQKKAIPYSLFHFALPVQQVNIRSALLGSTENIPTYMAIGRVCASLAVPCPPGMPIALPGEIISEEVAKRYMNGGILQLDVLK